MKVTETHWATFDRKRLAELSNELPAVLDTEFKLWQHRVDRKEQTPFVPHTHLYSMCCTRYAVRETDGYYAPVEPKEEYTFLVVAESRREAMDKCQAQLRAHGFNPDSFSYGSNVAILILN